MFNGGIPIPAAVRSKVYVWSRLIAWIAGSNPAEGMNVGLLWYLRVVQVAASVTSWSLIQRSNTGFARARVCVCVCVWEREI
jgi:hypothetical protein